MFTRRLAPARTARPIRSGYRISWQIETPSGTKLWRTPGTLPAVKARGLSSAVPGVGAGLCRQAPVGSAERMGRTDEPHAADDRGRYRERPACGARAATVAQGHQRLGERGVAERDQEGDAVDPRHGGDLDEPDVRVL